MSDESSVVNYTDFVAVGFSGKLGVTSANNLSEDFYARCEEITADDVTLVVRESSVFAAVKNRSKTLYYSFDDFCQALSLAYYFTFGYRSEKICKLPNIQKNIDSIAFRGTKLCVQKSFLIFYNDDPRLENGFAIIIDEEEPEDDRR